MQTQAIINHIVLWLKNYATQAKVKGYVVGISGGIDSAVVSALCAKTGLDTLCITLPIRQAPDQLQRANAHIAQLCAQHPNVRAHNQDLTPTFEQFERSVSGSRPQDDALAMANTRSRLRMTALYYFGQINGLLVAGTGNKVEDFGVGFFTKYGDGGVDVSPIADLLKTQVYELAKELGIHADIITATPTDGLWDTERTDEQQMGASYPELEWAMAQVAQGKSREQFTGRQQEVFDIYVRLNRMAQHKIQPIPVCHIPTDLFQAA
ncbi:NAD(+) synthase [Alysiella filiformis]|uniref:NH(3)-dependent NAD(+) synthetase n=1 Tax=Alysiella filiformis DSM 16848 TaxID=1120981 RepID=A0A286EDR2_9NEIS|nr:NAD(+) synthase [Alysiella filiformis]QMT31696.1 NAD(+) synthase [Alysiella filiformis]UBQ55295.1 NAD(+) synthase [Alysiella filiformis DSM 16848]SOD69043.1 NAD+ synthase [Alysiella filiformis DSM 16848]